MNRQKLVYTVQVGLSILFLLGIWFALTFIQIIVNDQNITMVKEPYNKLISDVSPDPIFKGEKRTFIIHSSQNNLGIITIKFNTYDRFNYDMLRFRIKEQHAQEWYFEETYSTRAFTSLNAYPFGFPILPNSQDKNYQIEIESLNGNKDSSVAIYPSRDHITASYQFEKKRLLQDQGYLLNFLFIKTTNSIQNYSLWYPVLVYSYLFVFYLFSLLKNSVWPHSSTKKLYLALIVIAIVMDILFIKRSFDLVYVKLALLLLYVLKYNRISERILFTIALSMCIAAVGAQLIGIEMLIQKLSTWIFIFMSVGFIASLQKYVLKKNK